MSVPSPSERVHKDPPLREAILGTGLYAIVDITSVVTRGLDPVLFAEAVLVACPAALQIRAKEVAARELLGLLRAVGSLCQRAGVPLVANDRVDLAVLAGCGYVHVGQRDLSVERVRRVAPGLRVGVSTHTVEQLTTALLARPDYVAFGPVFPTASKANPDPCVGLEGLERARELAAAAAVPLVAIGGISIEHAASVRRWSTASAVIHALLPTPSTSPSGAYAEVTARAVAIHEALGGSPARGEVARA